MAEWSCRAAVENAERLLREWVEEVGATAELLRSSPWDMPRDCPLWHLDLTLAQACAVLAKVRGEVMSNEGDVRSL